MDGSNSPVMVRCGRFQPPQSGPQGGGNSTEPTSNTSPTAIRGVNGINQSQDEAGNNKTGIIIVWSLSSFSPQKHSKIIMAYLSINCQSLFARTCAVGPKMGSALASCRTGIL